MVLPKEALRVASHFVLLFCAAAASTAQGPAPASKHSAAERSIDRAHAELWRRFIDEHHLVLDYVGLNGEIVRPTPDECREMKPSALSWGVPNENGPMFNGLYLDGACNRWNVTRAAEDRAKARRLIDGLITLSTVGKTPGFIARGLATDGATTYSMGSNDQTTPWLYGIWRYVTDGLAADDAEQRDLVKRFVTQVETLEANEWKIPTNGPPAKHRGNLLLSTWEGAPRILFICKAMHRFTSDPRWGRLYTELMQEELGENGLTRLAICRRGMVFDPVQGSRHSWTGSEGGVCLRALWEMEEDAIRKAAYAEGLRRSAELATKSLELAEQFNGEGTEVFDIDWHMMNHVWRPQMSEQDAVDVANQGLRIRSKHSPRIRIEYDFLREPCFAAWIVTLCPDADFVTGHRDAIEKVMMRYDLKRVYLSQFFPLESAWWRLQMLPTAAP